MGCGSCGTGGGCSPKGCKNNGTCNTGGCNKLNVYDWLGDMETPVGYKPFNIVEVRFKGSRKEFYKNDSNLELFTGDGVVVQSDNGNDYGHVSLSGELVRLQLKKYGVDPESNNMFKIYRRANEKDTEKYDELKAKEPATLERARTIALELKLHMKLSDIEFQGDGRKVVFFYTAEERVDFRELIKRFAEEFKVRIEMKQIGYRQEAARLGGIGSCGRELCCSTWLTDFKLVNTSAARFQNLSINMLKLSGQCGRLKCCLNFELDTYPEGMSIDENGLISWIPIEGQLTSDEVVLVVSDSGNDGALPFTQTFTISVEPVNDIPEIISNPPLIAYEDEQYLYQIEVSDPDSDIFYFTLLFGPDGLELSNSGLITWTPTEGILSSGTVAFVVWDTDSPEMGVDFPAIQEFVIEVFEVNDPPSIISVPPTSVIEDVEYLYQLEIEDIDDEIFFYELLEYPEGMSINSSGLLSWTALEGVSSSGAVSIKVYDRPIESSDGLYDVQNFALSVTAVNDPPVIISSAPTIAVQGEEYIYQIDVEDPDDSEFTYLLLNEPEGMTIDFETGLLSWIPNQGNIIYQDITLKVQDGGEDFVSPAIEYSRFSDEANNLKFFGNLDTWSPWLIQTVLVLLTFHL